MAGIYSVENPVFVSFVVNGAVLLLKMLAVVVCTVYYRMTKNVSYLYYFLFCFLFISMTC